MVVICKFSRHNSTILSVHFSSKNEASELGYVHEGAQRKIYHSMTSEKTPSADENCVLWQKHWERAKVVDVKADNICFGDSVQVFWLFIHLQATIVPLQSMKLASLFNAPIHDCCWHWNASHVDSTIMWPLEHIRDLGLGQTGYIRIHAVLAFQNVTGLLPFIYYIYYVFIIIITLYFTHPLKSCNMACSSDKTVSFL